MRGIITGHGTAYNGFSHLYSLNSNQILRQLKHENIIEMLDAFESPQEFCVVTEFAQVSLLSQLSDTGEFCCVQWPW